MSSNYNNDTNNLINKNNTNTIDDKIKDKIDIDDIDSKKSNNINNDDIQETKYENRLNLRKKYFDSNIERKEMPPLILYSINDLQDGTFLEDLNKYIFTIPDNLPFPDKDDKDCLNKINIIYNYQISEKYDTIIIKKIDNTTYEFKDYDLYLSLKIGENILLLFYNEFIQKISRLDFY